MNKKINVVQVNKLYAPQIGGIERVVQDIAEGLNDRTNMKVLVCQPKGRTVKEIYNNVDIIRAGSIGTFFSMPVSFSFPFYLKKLSKTADIIHFHYPFPLGDLSCILSGYKGKVVVWWHSDIVRQKKLMYFYKPIMKMFLKRADCIMVATQGNINSSEYLKEYKNKCVIIPFGIDINKFKENESKENIIAKYSKTDKIKILFVGRLVYYKGIEILLNAFLKTNNTELFIIGEGPLKDNLKEKIKEHNIENSVYFLGALNDSDLKACLRDCDILAFPSIANSEAFGLVQLEAMIYKKPVINTDLPTGVPFVSVNNISGITVKKENVQEFADAIQKLADDDEFRKKMGAGAYERALNIFDKNKMMDLIYEKYKQLLKLK